MIDICCLPSKVVRVEMRHVLKAVIQKEKQTAKNQPNSVSSMTSDRLLNPLGLILVLFVILSNCEEPFHHKIFCVRRGIPPFAGMPGENRRPSGA